MASGNHYFVSPTVFTKPDEFRIQSGHFANMRLLTVQECDGGRRLIDATWKPFISGEELASRPNYGKETKMHSWENTAKFWEIN